MRGENTKSFSPEIRREITKWQLEVIFSHPPWRSRIDQACLRGCVNSGAAFKAEQTDFPLAAIPLSLLQFWGSGSGNATGAATTFPVALGTMPFLNGVDEDWHGKCMKESCPLARAGGVMKGRPAAVRILIMQAVSPNDPGAPSDRSFPRAYPPSTFLQPVVLLPPARIVFRVEFETQGMSS